MTNPLRWDIFCRVIDNFGDIGVCWRLAGDLAARGHTVRLWADDLSALAWLAPQGRAGVQALPWPEGAAIDEPGDVVIEAFGCEPPPAFLAAMARLAADGKACVWINLEYLTAEPFAERAHGLPSPVMSGPAAGLTRHFFYPGFTARTGGLIREDGLRRRQAAFDRQAWLAAHGIPYAGEELVSLFCYEPAALPALLAQLDAQAHPARLLVTAGRAQRAVEAAMGAHPAARLAVTFLPLLPQAAFDELLWACQLNFVRGEDSLVRAIWAGAPFVWQAYPQDDGAHWPKLDAMLDTLQAPASLRAFHHAWNAPVATALPQPDLAGWGQAALEARSRLGAQDDLVTQLQGFVLGRRFGR